MTLTGDVVSEELIQGLASQIDQFGLLIKGLGIIAVIWAVYSLAMFWLEKRQLDKMKNIENAIFRLERKIGKIKGKS